MNKPILCCLKIKSATLLIGTLDLVNIILLAVINSNVSLINNSIISQIFICTFYTRQEKINLYNLFKVFFKI